MFRNKKYIIGACGYYDTVNTISNGQTIKTQTVTDALKIELGSDNVSSMCYQKWRKNPFVVLFSFIRLLFISRNIILFPDQRAYKVLIPLSVILKPIARTKISYVVIGGWLPVDIAKYPILLWFVKRLDNVLVETTQLRNSLQEQGLKNIEILTNFKFTEIINKDDLNTKFKLPYKTCFISRVNSQKGVSELVKAICEINRDDVKFQLDIYGGIEEEYQVEFNSLDLGDNIQYKGELESEEVSKVMSDYFLHILPTKYRTEGVPGSILDGFYAGVPTLASRWNSVDDVINDNVDGLVFEFEDFEDMKAKLMYAYNNPDKIIEMKYRCIKRGSMYSPQEVIKVITNKLSM